MRGKRRLASKLHKVRFFYLWKAADGAGVKRKRLRRDDAVSGSTINYI